MRRTSAVLSIALGTLATGAALAHTELASTVPANGAVIMDAPENLELTFSDAVRLTALSIQKDGEQKQSLGPLPSANVKEFSVALPATIDDGHYVIAWRALSQDTHVMTGEFMFALGAEATHEAHTIHADMPAGQHHAMPATEHHAMPAAEHHDNHH